MISLILWKLYLSHGFHVENAIMAGYPDSALPNFEGLREVPYPTLAESQGQYLLDYLILALSSHPCDYGITQESIG